MAVEPLYAGDFFGQVLEMRRKPILGGTESTKTPRSVFIALKDSILPEVGLSDIAVSLVSHPTALPFRLEVNPSQLPGGFGSSSLNGHRGCDHYFSEPCLYILHRTRLSYLTCDEAPYLPWSGPLPLNLPQDGDNNACRGRT